MVRSIHELETDYYSATAVLCLDGRVAFKPWHNAVTGYRSMANFKQDEFYTHLPEDKPQAVTRWSYSWADSLDDFKKIMRARQSTNGCYIWLWHSVHQCFYHGDVNLNSLERLD